MAAEQIGAPALRFASPEIYHYTVILLSQRIRLNRYTHVEHVSPRQLAGLRAVIRRARSALARSDRRPNADKTPNREPIGPPQSRRNSHVATVTRSLIIAEECICHRPRVFSPGRGFFHDTTRRARDRDTLRRPYYPADAPFSVAATLNTACASRSRGSSTGKM